MLTIRYEQSLVETAVFLAVRRDEQMECELHRAIDPLYEIPDEEIRQRKFAPVFHAFFTKLGFDRLIGGLLAERPLVGERVDQCVVREAARQKTQSAELLVQGNKSNKGREVRASRTLVVQICPQSFLETERPIALMRRELLHVADMLDEQFGYVRDTFSGTPSRQNLQRDRYRVLWDTYVEGRLEREQFGVSGEKDRLGRAFGRVFENRNAAADGVVFERVFGAASLTHRNFMDWAREPASLFASPSESSHVAGNTGSCQAASESLCPATHLRERV